MLVALELLWDLLSFFYYVNLWRSIGEECRGDEEVEDLMFCLLKLCIIW
jgi:hypothetical protein